MAAQHQHYVPQLLLRGFLSRDPKLAVKEQVHVFDLKEGVEFSPSIANVMGERRFNDFWIDDETLATIEPATSRIESHFAPLIERIRDEKRLTRTAEELADLSLLLAFQFIRTKKMRLLPERLNSFMKAHVRRLGFDPSKVDGIEEWTEDKLKIQHVRQQFRSLEDYARAISDKEFFLMRSPEGSSFYLGDHPVVLHNDEESRGRMGRLGLAAPYIQIYLPLSAEIMLCAYDRAVLGQLMRGRDEVVAEGQGMVLRALMDGKITAAQMKSIIESGNDYDITTPLIAAIRAGEPVIVGSEQVQCYNSLQAFQAHRFVIDPDGKFNVAREMVSERQAAEQREGAVQ